MKEVYVENWGTTILFVRVQLSEYMEMGDGAGLFTPTGFHSRLPHAGNRAVSLIPGAVIHNQDTWRVHAPHGGNVTDCGAVFHDYWTWAMGGQKFFRTAPSQPDFPRDGTQDQINRWVAQNTQVYLQGHYNTDPNIRQTLPATVITMARWHELNKPIGNYWVVDTDGWAYWASPLNPGSATGLLLREVHRIEEIEEDWYYGINVWAQMGTRGGSDNVFDFGDNGGWTNNGEDLINIITGGESSDPGTGQFRVFIVPNAASVARGSSRQFGTLILGAANAVATEAVVWSVEGAASPGTGIDSSGNLTIAANETASVIVVRATVVSDPQSSGTAVIQIVGGGGNGGTGGGLPGLANTGIGNTLRIDGIDWIKVTTDGDYALLLKEDIIRQPQFMQVQFNNTSRGVIYEGSNAQALVTNWYGSANIPTIKQFAVVPTNLNQQPARRAFNGFSRPTNVSAPSSGKDIMFLLSLDEAFLLSQKQRAMGDSIFWWTRSEKDNNDVFSIRGNGNSRSCTPTHSVRKHIRPAVWVRM
jgi:hypothetical protein